MIVLFAGPSLAGTLSYEYPGFDFRPPAKQGDLYLAVEDGADAIGLIDGVFDGVPSVWHKEVLWAIDQGVPVFGASSMGALRAAELDVFGMVGIGAVYDAYRDGALEDDDEVALQHGPAETGFAPLSLAMVNIRATLEKAVSEGVVSAQVSDQAASLAKCIHFKERTWTALLAALRGNGDAELTAVADWLRDNYVDRKNLDALMLLDHISRQENWPGEHPSFHFEQTEMWRRGVADWRRAQKRVTASPSGAYRLVPEDSLYRSTGTEE
ncbi:TfuA-like protein [Hoeflea prorocentri]|uniref:TfuA-like protein n=1 Tax=Hoeflea prorocentri TaxID=1922333 RepID=A0A9X3UPJ8_9HYPH|nr:TfuA-like protein [Hoeflea prorocentri]MCY6382851.1 TfuA-like protein [Hoeflea prorocentri]MDA5400651.1 TfuA-like protein [Hoeflea prorocentri]